MYSTLIYKLPQYTNNEANVGSPSKRSMTKNHNEANLGSSESSNDVQEIKSF